jgi:hypothetical protein
MAARAGLIRRIDRLLRSAAMAFAVIAGLIPGGSSAQDGWVDLPNESVLVSEGPAPSMVPAQPPRATPDDGIIVGSEDEGTSWISDQDGSGHSGLLGPVIANQDVLWVGRVDALIAWRDAPPDRPLVETGLSGTPVLNANGMDSPAAAGPRFSIFRFNDANGTAIETTYFQIANWRSERPLSAQSDLYALAPPGFYGNGNTQNFDTGTVNLGAWMKSLEVNRHWWIGEHARFLAGFRWVEWQENFSLSDEFVGTQTIQDFYSTECFNSLYGGQIGIDGVLFSLPWMRVDSIVKAGAYYNNGVQRSSYTSNATGPFLTQSVAIDQSPVSASFLGEVGLTGVIPVTNWLDVRVGYSGWWLSGIVQPTQQLSGQVLTQPAGGVEPTSGTINADGGVFVQAVTIGLEGRW